MLQTTFAAVSVEPADVADFILGAPLRILAIVIIAWFVNRIARRGVQEHAAHAELRRRPGTRRQRCAPRRPPRCWQTQEHSLRSEQRIDALTSVLRSLVTFVIYTVAVFMILGEIGINLGPLIAGAGIIGVALGFGSQSLVKDFLSGVFILVEDQFGVGDIVDLDGQTSGTVDAVSLRTTRLRSVDGTLWHVPNGEIRRVGNKSQHWSRALIDIEVAYDTDLDHAEAVIARVADEIATRRRRRDRAARGLGRRAARRERHRHPPRRQDAPVRAVPRLARAAPRDQGRLRREGIEIPFPQQTVWHRPMPVAANGDQN